MCASSVMPCHQRTAFFHVAASDNLTSLHACLVMQYLLGLQSSHVQVCPQVDAWAAASSFAVVRCVLTVHAKVTMAP
jgi:hypothetical protein